MKVGKRIAGIAILMLCVTSLFAATVTVDFDKKADFSKYKSYSWAKKPSIGNPLAEERIIEILDKELQARGMQKVDEGQGDLLLAVSAAVDKQTRLDTFYDGYAGYGYGGWAAPMGSTTVATTYRVGTLLVDLFDASNKQLVWRGQASDALSTKPETNQKKMTKIAKKLFAKYPPAPAK